MISEKTSEERRTPDFRHQECKHWHYNEHLPMVSIIIIFQDEDFSGHLEELSDLKVKAVSHRHLGRVHLGRVHLANQAGEIATKE